MEPVSTLAAGAIVQLAFNELIKSSAGEAAKKLTGEAILPKPEPGFHDWNLSRFNHRSALSIKKPVLLNEILEKMRSKN